MPEVGLEPEFPDSQTGTLIKHLQYTQVLWTDMQLERGNAHHYSFLAHCLQCWIDFEKQIVPSVMLRLPYETMTLGENGLGKHRFLQSTNLGLEALLY